MKTFDRRCVGVAAGLRRVAVLLLSVLLAAGPVTMARADETPPAAMSTNSARAAWAMRWFAKIQAGRTDRSQYSADFAPEVTDKAVARMSHDLNAYGAAPLRAEIVRTAKEGDETFATIKFVFPRGDATGILFGFDSSGKVTGVAPAGMAGD